MKAMKDSRILRTVPLLIAVYLISIPAKAKYGGGTGEPNDPYQIGTAEDLILLGETPEDYDKHFVLTDDIDLGGHVFDKAVIAPDTDGATYSFEGTSFTGVFDGKGHRIFNLVIAGGNYVGLFGLLEPGAEVRDLGVVHVNATSSYGSLGGLVGCNFGYVNRCYSTGVVNGTGQYVGGLVGYNGGSVTQCYSTGVVSGTGQYVGGLVGDNEYGSVTQCYSTGTVSGGSYVGGLVGYNSGAVLNSYSTGSVSGQEYVGGLVGYKYSGIVTACFWDVQTSGRTISAGGTGKTTAEMHTAGTFLGWWYGSIWTIDEGKDYPHLWWENMPGEPIASPYGGGSGTPADPYLIHTADQLNTIGLVVSDWDKHFRLIADIDLSGFDGKEGRPVFNIIAPDTDTVKQGFQGTIFTGIFDGNGHTISNLTIKGVSYVGLFGSMASGAQVRDLGVVDVNITGSGYYVGGLVGYKFGGTVTQCYSTGAVSGTDCVGGLVGNNGSWDTPGGNVTQCYSTGAVSGDFYVGGLVGGNYEGTVTQCYSTGAVSGIDCVGGLVGGNTGAVTCCYATGVVSGTEWSVGGLVGLGYTHYHGYVKQSFWDMQTSGQSTSEGGTGKTTAEMRMASTFLEAGWDFMGETKNGTEDIWGILEGRDYPRLAWEYWTFSPDPGDGATDVIRRPILSWRGAMRAGAHDIYFGNDKDTVANATPQTQGIYLGRQVGEMVTYDLGTLEWNKTYYWRIDEVNDADPNSPWKGDVWSFTTADFIVVTILDDFESYTDDMADGQTIFQTWLDGYGWVSPEPNYPGNDTGSTVGNLDPPFAEIKIVHVGRQSMPMDFNNVNDPCYSEAERTWGTPQDWTTDDADTLTLYFRGDPNNGRDSLYVAIEDSAGQITVVTHPDANAVLTSEWQKWHIPLADLRVAGVDVMTVKKMYIGVGDRDNPQPGGTGIIYIDDIRLTKRIPYDSERASQFIAGDFNADYKVDFDDLALLSIRWRSVDSRFFWCRGTDLTNDGFVDFEDLSTFTENWLAGQ